MAALIPDEKCPVLVCKKCFCEGKNGAVSYRGLAASSSADGTPLLLVPLITWWNHKLLDVHKSDLFFLILPRQCTYFCLASQMALLGFIFIERERKSLYENSYHLMPRPGFELTSVACTTLWDLNSGPLYQLSYRDRGTFP